MQNNVCHGEELERGHEVVLPIAPPTGTGLAPAGRNMSHGVLLLLLRHKEAHHLPPQHGGFSISKHEGSS